MNAEWPLGSLRNCACSGACKSSCGKDVLCGSGEDPLSSACKACLQKNGTDGCGKEHDACQADPLPPLPSADEDAGVTFGSDPSTAWYECTSAEADHLNGANRTRTDTSGGSCWNAQGQWPDMIGSDRAPNKDWCCNACQCRHWTRASWCQAWQPTYTWGPNRGKVCKSLGSDACNETFNSASKRLVWEYFSNPQGYANPLRDDATPTVGDCMSACWNAGYDQARCGRNDSGWSLCSWSPVRNPNGSNWEGSGPIPCGFSSR